LTIELKARHASSLLFLTENLRAQNIGREIFSLPICVIMVWVMKMDNDKDLPKRKSTRLKNFDYSSAGAYFVTICVRDRMQILSEIVRTDLTSANKTIGIAVGEGLAPPEITVKLKPCGEIVKEQLQLIETRFPSVTVEDYVIMPDHIHAVIFLHGKAGGASPSPTLDDVICAFKSLTSRSCKQKYGIEKMFQRSSAEHIVRDREDYETRRKYIYENPKRWYYKYLNTIE
jgi:REP element-mobilizing transposase RayT